MGPKDRKEDVPFKAREPRKVREARSWDADR